MSDPFEAFESAASNGNGNGAGAEDPAAAFLAREEVEFAKVVNNDFSNDAFGSFGGEGGAGESGEQTDGGDPFAAADQTGSENKTSNELVFDAPPADLLAGGVADAPVAEEATPAVVEQTPPAPAEQAAPAKPDFYSAISSADRFAQEPEKIKIWREEQKARLAQKDTEEEQKKKEWKETAKKELEDWYKNRQEQLAKTHANNKAAEAELVASRDSTTPGLEWERMAKLCDFNPKANKNTKDVSRMRSILLQLKQQPLVRQTN